ncbi:MAG: hypothetical protein ABSC94_31220 [Polyangiaceae bacterium]
MSSAGDPPVPKARGESSMDPAEISPEDLDRLASTFRPSWEIDEAPFAAPVLLSPADMLALRANDAQPSQTPPAQAPTNGTTSAPPGAASSPTVESTGAGAAQSSPPTSGPGTVPLGVQLFQDPRLRGIVPWVPPEPNPAARNAAPLAVSSTARSRLDSVALAEAPPFAKGSKKAMWVTAILATLFVGAVSVWALGPGDGANPATAAHASAAPPNSAPGSASPLPAAHPAGRASTTADRGTMAPAAQPTTGTTAAPTTTVPAAPATVTPLPFPVPQSTFPVLPSPPPAAPPRAPPPAPAPPAYRPPYVAPARAAAPVATPRPTPHPKGNGETIVRDVPF